MGGNCVEHFDEIFVRLNEGSVDVFVRPPVLNDLDFFSIKKAKMWIDDRNVLRIRGYRPFTNRCFVYDKSKSESKEFTCITEKRTSFKSFFPKILYSGYIDSVEDKIFSIETTNYTVCRI